MASESSDPAVQDALQFAAAAFRAGRYEQALIRLRAVEAAVGDDASVRWNIARCLEELGRTREAVEAFDRAAAASRVPADRQAAADRADRLRRTLPGAVWVECPVSGRVSLGELPSQPCPARFEEVAPGPTAGVVELADGMRRFELTVAGDQIHRVEIDRPAPPAEATPAAWPGWVTLGGAAIAGLAGVLCVAHANGVAARAGDAALRDDRGDYDRFQGEYEAFTTLGYSLYGVSLALAGVGVWLVLDDDAPQPAARARREVGLGLSFTF